MPMSSAAGQNPGPARETPNPDGQSEDAPTAISVAAQDAADAAIAHSETEARKVAM